jgi:curved DNA-binding protein CbpA
MRKPTYYDVLKVRPDSSFEDIKSSYQKLILLHHPDKSDASDAAEKFRLILDAWRILGSVEERKLYDREVGSENASVVFGEETLLSEFSGPEDDIYFKTCRCGGEYEVIWLVLP